MEIWNNIYRKNQDIVSRQIAGENIKVPRMGTVLDMQKIYSLNKIGEYIWQKLDDTVTLKQILNLVLDKFEVSKEQAEKDILTFIGELLNNNLITICT